MAAEKFTPVEETVETKFGPVHVIVHGDREKPVILTYHDIGLNSTSCFNEFFNDPNVLSYIQFFCVVHVNAIGQEKNAPTLPQGYIYPLMDDLASTIDEVMDNYKIRTIVGFGVGAGANVLSRFALSNPEKVVALILLNAVETQAGIIEMGYQKWKLNSAIRTEDVKDYMVWHWFGSTSEINQDLLNVYMEYVKSLNPTNLGHFISSYIKHQVLSSHVFKRTDLCIVENQKFECSVMLVAGKSSPQFDDTKTMSGKMDPKNTRYYELNCDGMILKEASKEICCRFILFLSGVHYPNMSRAWQEQLLDCEARKEASRQSWQLQKPTVLKKRQHSPGSVYDPPKKAAKKEQEVQTGG